MSAKTANIKKEFILDLPKPHKLVHPMINSITNEIIFESNNRYSNPYGDDEDSVVENSFARPVTVD